MFGCPWRPCYCCFQVHAHVIPAATQLNYLKKYLLLERFAVVAHLLVDAAESAGRFHLLVVEFSGDGNLILQIRDGLLEVKLPTR